MSTRDKILSSIFGVLILAAIASIIYVTLAPPTTERFTEFYVLGVEARAEDYPSELVVGEEGKVRLGIENYEWQEIAYRVEVRIDGEDNNKIGPIVLAHRQKWMEGVGFIPDKTGEDQKVEFLLFKQGESEPYDFLYLLVDVK